MTNFVSDLKEVEKPEKNELPCEMGIADFIETLASKKEEDEKYVRFKVLTAGGSKEASQ